jgi:hypothetical protein
MTSADREAFAEILATLAANFRAELSPIQARVIWLALKDELTVAQLERAAARALRERTFMPNVAELLELAGKKRGGAGRKIQVIDGKPWVWHEESGWGRYYGPLDRAARLVGMEPDAAKDIVGHVLAELAPPANETGGKR